MIILVVKIGKIMYLVLLRKVSSLSMKMRFLICHNKVIRNLICFSKIIKFYKKINVFLKKFLLPSFAVLK